MSENSLENLMGVAVTRHTQLLRFYFILFCFGVLFGVISKKKKKKIKNADFFFFFLESLLIRKGKKGVEGEGQD